MSNLFYEGVTRGKIRKNDISKLFTEKNRIWLTGTVNHNKKKLGNGISEQNIGLEMN